MNLTSWCRPSSRCSREGHDGFGPGPWCRPNIKHQVCPGLLAYPFVTIRLSVAILLFIHTYLFISFLFIQTYPLPSFSLILDYLFISFLFIHTYLRIYPPYLCLLSAPILSDPCCLSFISVWFIHLHPFISCCKFDPGFAGLPAPGPAHA